MQQDKLRGSSMALGDGLGVPFGVHRPKRKSFAESVVGLVSHLLGAAVIFVAFFTIAWCVSWLLHKLHGVHPFPDEIFRLVTRVEVWAIYADAVLCAIVSLAGAARFCVEILEART
jgi:hypothetical protein